ncbi:MAG: mechanosensitive ion channel [Pegethrix bostrychoides GSE-TBD4-15B]|uniref:Mechanosensitive ion channel n=1 Tax=Pegethrix bostrychoides GSE-TBD4-15B TaxID=2839662 RepID=A0A951PE40_9CYAN|nr:mechanosensitive ion channel [Pegethrix bostrychoides GSE-TBD4-15B]
MICFGIALLLVLRLGSPSALAQAGSRTAPESTTSEATVTLDGQPIFQISDAGQYSAQARADLISLQLQAALQMAKPLSVKIEPRNRLPTLLLNDRYLLTVTEQDAQPNSTPDEQAIIWQERLQTKLRQALAERRPAYLQKTIALAIGIILAVAALHLGLRRAQQRGLQSLQQLLHMPTDASKPSRPVEGLSKLLLALVQAGLWIGAALYIANLFPLSRAWSYRVSEALFTSLTSPLMTLGRNAYSVIDLLLLALLLLALFSLAGMATNLLRSRVLHLAGLSRGGQEVIATLTKYSLITIGTLVVLQIWGLDISSLTILASALGVGIGFGLQNIVKDFGSGLVLVFERPIQVGDFVEVGSFKGTVERIGGRSTEIRTMDHVSIILPNSRFLEEEVINWSHRNPISRLHLPVGVAYSSEPEAVKTTLLEAAQSHHEVLSSPPPQVFFTGFGESSLDFDLLVWITQPSHQFILKSDLYFRIFALLRERQIEIPFPQRDLHLRSGTLNLSPQIEALFKQRQP